MTSEKLIFICLAVVLVHSDATKEINPSVGTISPSSSSGKSSLEELKNPEADSKSKSISTRYLDSLFGLGIGGHLLGVHAGAGIGHGKGGYGDLGQGFVGKPSGGQNPQPIYIPQPPPQVYYVQAPPRHQVADGMPYGIFQGMLQEKPQRNPQIIPQGKPPGKPQRMPQGKPVRVPTARTPKVYRPHC
ncbi:uncharacterized protein LOC124356341 [Homalodisca vitripennis]|uniref:uncharacterized protein LOC124356341 n=1 Tax=Homalodisca vitripennis TaxID=197043 RepID=UPI001EECBDF7|nr:uncharacterized protein LOC124356341 [Homalodisca vitripennis]